MTIKIGDHITFKAATRHSYAKATRIVTGFWGTTGMPTVRFHGWHNFVVRHHEVLAINGEPCE
jgi:hypothetical protein